MTAYIDNNEQYTHSVEGEYSPSTPRTQLPLISWRNAAFAYTGEPVLTGVNGELNSGEALALVGPNGSGKTTLLKAILGMVALRAGNMSVLGAQPGKYPPGSVAYVPQVADLDPTFPISVAEVVKMGLYSRLGFFRTVDRELTQRCRSALAEVGLLEKAAMRFGELSGGQQQRVLLARCSAARPQLVLLDEPFNGLDQPNREALLGIVNRLKKRGIGLVISTHDLELAHTACEKVALLAGRQIAFGPREQVLTPELIEQTFGFGHRQ